MTNDEAYVLKYLYDAYRRDGMRFSFHTAESLKTVFDILSVDMDIGEVLQALAAKGLIKAEVAGAYTLNRAGIDAIRRLVG